MLKGQLKVGFTLGLAEKDVKLACKLGEASGVPMPFGALTSGIYRDMVTENGYGAEVETSGLITEARAQTRFIPEDRSA